MKRLLLSTILIALSTFSAKSQVACTITAPDQTGVYPSQLADACQNSPYTQDISFAVVNDTCVDIGGPSCYNATFQSATVNNINLPAGLTYECESSDCIYYPDAGTHTKGCIRVSGTPTISNPSFTVTLDLTINYSGVNSPINLDVEMNINPAPTADAGVDVGFCSGSGGVTLAGSGGGTYSWSPTTGLSPTNTATPTANPSATTTYTMTVTDGNSCTDEDDIEVAVYSLPTANAGADDAICEGTSETATITATGGTSYSWDNSLGSGASHTVSPSATTTYTVTVSDINSCTDTDDVTITVNAPGVGGCVTGIGNGISSKSLSASPNPTNGLITFSSKVTGVIFDVMGNSLIEIKEADSVDLSALNSGVYIFNSSNGTIRITKD